MLALDFFVQLEFIICVRMYIGVKSNDTNNTRILSLLTIAFLDSSKVLTDSNRYDFIFIISVGM